MKYVVDDLDFETATRALEVNQYGFEVSQDSRGPAYVTIWTENAYEGTLGNIGGYIVGSVAANPNAFIRTYTLTLEEHNNDRERMAAVLTNILRRKSMR